LRTASEEEDLARTFRAEYEQYRLRTRWRYLPGVRCWRPSTTIGGYSLAPANPIRVYAL